MNVSVPPLSVSLYVSFDLFSYPVFQYCTASLKQFAISLSFDYSDFSNSKISSCLYSLHLQDHLHHRLQHIPMWNSQLLYDSSMPLQKSVLNIILVSSSFASMEARLTDLYFPGLVTILKYWQIWHLLFLLYWSFRCFWNQWHYDRTFGISRIRMLSS